MVRVSPTAPPEGSLIGVFVQAPAHYSDAFMADISGPVSLSDVIRAFYTTPLFRAERVVLRLAGLRGGDADVARLAEGTTDRFAAWQVEARREDEILLADVSGRTKSWLAVRAEGDKAGATRVYFGSVIVPAGTKGHAALGPVFRVLIGPHRLYSRLLLAAALRRLQRRG